ncbi:MAG: PorT family protein [Bacteroidales bacterium]|nr:PorT family protein [Bacteroidales bacterium]
MAEKWNDKLRKQLSDYTQAPPEGVWDAVEGHLARGRSAAAFPWWWALAGAAAALVALLVVVRPSSEKQSPAVGPVVAELADTALAPPAKIDTVVVNPLTPVDIAVPVTTAAPVNSVAPRHRDLSDVAVAQAVDQQGAEAPVTEDASSQVQNPIVEDDFNPSQEEPAEEEKAPEKPIHILPQKQYPAERPLLADASTNRAHISLLTSGALGAVPSNTIAEYGMSGTMRMASSSRSMSPVSVLSRNKSTVTDIKHRLVYRVGIMANVPLSRRWSIETGLQLSRLASDVISTSGTMTSSTHTDMHYFGVPLMAVYTPWSGRHLSVYLSAGPSVEYGFRSSGNIREVIGNLAPVVRNIDKYTPGDFIWSLGANVGAQWAFGNFGALFVQPGVSWHIAGENSPESYYTANPVAFNLSGGFRILF